MGHNLCLDIFGGPADEKFAAGMMPHGQGSVVPYKISETDGQLTMWAHLRLARFCSKGKLLPRT